MLAIFESYPGIVCYTVYGQFDHFRWAFKFKQYVMICSVVIRSKLGFGALFSVILVRTSYDKYNSKMSIMVRTNFVLYDVSVPVFRYLSMS